MPNDQSPNDWKALWQSQNVEPVTVSLEEIRRQTLRLQRKIRLRNFTEYAASALIVVFFGWNMVHFPGPMRAAAALLIAGVLYMVWQLHRRGSPRSMPADLAVHTGIAFHRRELERQRDLVRHVWSWYLGPMIPGMAAILVAALLNHPGGGPYGRLFLAVYAAAAALAFYLVGRLNLRAARKLQTQIDRLQEMEGKSQ